MNCFVDFSEELSRLTLSERPNSLFEFCGEASHLHDAAVMPSEFDIYEISNSGSCGKPCRQNRSSSSGFLKTNPASTAVRRSLTADRGKCELSDQEASCNRHASTTAMNQLDDTLPSNSISQQKSAETSSSSVKSWAAVLAEGRNTQQPVPTSAVRGSQTGQPKPSNSLSIKNTPVNQAPKLKSAVQSQTDKSKSRSATHGSDRILFSSSNAVGNRTKSNDRMSTTHCESQSSAWVTVSSHDRKTNSRSQSRQSHSDVSAHSADVKAKQHKSDGESTGIVAAADAADAPNSQSKASKQKKKKKKKKKKSKGPDVALEETSNPIVRAEMIHSQPAPEFNNLTEFPSLFSLKSGSKKTPLLTSSSSSTANMPRLTSGISELVPD